MVCPRRFPAPMIKPLCVFTAVLLFFCGCTPKGGYVRATEEHIRTILTKPESAKFAPQSEISYESTENGLLVIGWVEAKNQYGISGRLGYRSTVGTDQFTKKPMVITLDFVDPVTGVKIDMATAR